MWKQIWLQKNLPIVVTLRWSFENVALSLEIPNNFDIITELGIEHFFRYTNMNLVMPTIYEKADTVTDSFCRNAFDTFVSSCHSYTHVKTIDVYWSESEKNIICIGLKPKKNFLQQGRGKTKNRPLWKIRHTQNFEPNFIFIFTWHRNRIKSQTASVKPSTLNYTQILEYVD